MEINNADAAAAYSSVRYSDFVYTDEPWRDA